MNEDTLVVVHCYQGDAALVRTCLKCFVHHERPVLILSPADSPVEIEYPGVENKSAGKAGWKGIHTLWRQMDHWGLALESDAQWFLLNDADSLCITPEIPAYLYTDPYKVWCNVLCHENEHQEDDHPNLNPPYFMHRNVLTALLERGRELEPPPDDVDPDIPPGAYWQAIDGFYTMLTLNELKIPYENYPDGATTWPRGWGDMVDQVKDRGARMLHGVKTNSELTLLQFAWNTWTIEQRRRQEAYQGYDGLVDGQTITVEI